MQNSSSLPEARELFNAAYKIGKALDRKFEREDMNPLLRQAAVAYAANYEGDFPYMVEMRAAVTATISGNGAYLSDGQAKGVLNCLMADARRRLADRPAARVEAAVVTSPVLTRVPDGRYRVTLVDGQHLAVRIERVAKDSKLPQGTRVISTRINGDDWLGMAAITPEGAFKLWRAAQGDLRDRISNAVEILDQAETQDGWLIAGLAFAQEGSQCFFCGRDLDTPESLLVGYGPKCADKHGLPWGDKAVPMAVRLAQAEAASKVEEAAAEAAPSSPTSSNTPVEEAATVKTVSAQAPVSRTEAIARGRSRTYAEIFGED
jgi:hypothetical protein